MLSRSLVSSGPAYHLLDDAEVVELESPDDKTEVNTPSAKPHRRCSSRLTLSILIITLTILATIILILILSRSTSLPPPSSSCPIRHEWRTLTPSQKSHYITSAKCLLTIPSTLPPGLSISLYEDFPYIHAHIGYRTHNSAPFLPWHRYFLHVYETALKTHCNYTGELVYWDWTLDAPSLHLSPVFDPDVDTGFGTNGDMNSEVTVGQTGRCVTDGAFANLTAHYYDVKKKTHCLSRGFRDDEGTLGVIDGSELSADSIEKVLQLDSYEGFVGEMERRVHDAVPFGIGGDFETFTAPYDPLFWLHHTQLDRVWALWQKRGGEGLYEGFKGRHEVGRASVEDVLVMKGLGGMGDVKVMDVLGTEGEGVLCYGYD